VTGLRGVVLAGGAGRRYGGGKPDALVGGLSLLVRALRALAPVTDAVGVVGEGPAAVPPGVPVRADLRPGLGPLAGLETALAWAAEEGRDGVAVLASDLPLVGAEVVGRLVREWRAGTGRRSSCVVAGVGAEREPLCGVYGVDLLEPLSSHLAAGGDRGVQRWVATLTGLRELPVAELVSPGVAPEALLLNVNRPDDRVRAELLLDPVPPVVAVVGWKDAGKTTVAVKLVGALRERGLRVVALKHGHRFEIDTPGTDSWRLRHEGGAARVVLAGPDEAAVMGDWGPAGEPSLAELVRRHAADADVVVAEGWKREPVPAIEVRRAGPAGERPELARGESDDLRRFLAVVAAGPGGASEPPRLDPDDPALGARLAALVVARLLPERAASG
jgi:molybdopterin-guanine dinucleotide biosynthesis protein MobB